MEKSNKTENLSGAKESVERKIPKPAKSLSTKETSSKTSEVNKTTQSSKSTRNMVTITSSKQKQMQNANLPKNMKRMSIVEISNEVMNHFQDENLKTGDYTTQLAAGIEVIDKEIPTKRVPLKDKFSQGSQKQCRKLPKSPSAPDLKSCAAFGGIRFTAKRNTYRKFNMFQKVTKESKDSQAVNPSEPRTKALKPTASATAITSKEVECSNEENLEVLPTVTAESSKATTLAMKETTLKKFAAFGGIRFSPKWQSTPLKPDLFGDMQKVSEHDKELHTPDPFSKGLENVPTSEKAITTPEETIQSSSKGPKKFKPLFITDKEISEKIYPAFAGMRLTPKRKSTHAKPDIFESMQKELKTDHLESQSSDSSTKDSKAIPSIQKIKVENQFSDDELLKTQKPELSKDEDASKNVKKVIPPAFGGLRFKPRQKNLHDVFEARKSKVENQMRS